MVFTVCPLPSCFPGDIPGRPTLHMCIQRVSVPLPLMRLAIWTRLGPPDVEYTMVSAIFMKCHPKSPNATHAQMSVYRGAPGLPGLASPATKRFVHNCFRTVVLCLTLQYHVQIHETLAGVSSEGRRSACLLTVHEKLHT